MCNPKIKLLNKELKKPKLDPEEKITMNNSFKNNNIKLSVIPNKTREEVKAKEVNPQSEAIKR
jgi:hypothetical protein